MEKDCNFEEGGLQCRLENTGKAIPKWIFHEMQHFWEFERTYFGMILQMHLYEVLLLKKTSNMDTLMFYSITLLLCVIILVLKKINQFHPEYIDFGCYTLMFCSIHRFPDSFTRDLV